MRLPLPVPRILIGLVLVGMFAAGDVPAEPRRLTLRSGGETRVIRPAPAVDTQGNAPRPAGLREFPHDLRGPGAPARQLTPLRERIGRRRGLPGFDRREGIERAAMVVHDTMRVALIRIDFENDREPDLTTGDGRFDLRTGTGVLVDPPPHDRDFFLAHGEALRRFYAAQSFGSLHLEFEVFPPGQAGAYSLSDRADYGPWEVTQDQVVIDAAETFVTDAVRAAEAAGDIAFSDFDAYILFHAGADFQGDVERDTPLDIPSFTITLGEPIETTTGSIGRLMVLPETANQDERLAALNGVFAHEFGHILGLPDLYDIFSGIPQVGWWSLMDSGENIAAIVVDPETEEEFEADGIFPTSFDPWSRLQIFPSAIGVFEVGETWEDVLEAVQVGTTYPVVAMDTEEYFILENRALDLDGNEGVFVFQDSVTGVFYGPVADPDLPDGDGELEYDAVLPDGGVLIWHIDETIVFGGLANVGAVNFDVFFRGIAVEEADGIWDIGRSQYFFGRPEDVWHLGNGTLFDPTSTPNSSSNEEFWSGVTVEVTSAASRNMSLRAARAAARDGWPLRLLQSEQVRIDLGPSTVVDLSGDGAPELVFDLTIDIEGEPIRRGLAALRNDATGYVPPGVSFPDNRFYGYSNPLTGPLVSSAAFQLDDTATPPVAVVAGVSGSRVFLTNSAGDTLLTAPSTNPGTSGPALLDRPSGADWIVYAGNGAVNGMVLPGTVVWSATSDAALDALPVRPPVVAPAVSGVSGPSVAVGFEGGLIEIFRPDEAARPAPILLGEDIIELATGLVDGGSAPDPDLIAVTGDSVAVISWSTGEILHHWPHDVPGTPARGFALGDLDGDGRAEIALGTDEGRVGVWNADGSLSLGWPRVLPTTFFGETRAVNEVKILDLDDDGDLDVFALSDDGTFFGWTGGGDPVDGYPRTFGAWTPVEGGQIAAIDGDDRLSWLATAAEGAVVATRLPGAAATEGDWRYPRGDAGGGGFVLVPGDGGLVVGRPDLQGETLFVYPNPARSQDVEIRFLLDENERANLTILDVRGQALPVDIDPRGGFGPGENAARWRVGATAPGLYFCRLERDGPGGKRVDLAKVVLMR